MNHRFQPYFPLFLIQFLCLVSNQVKAQTHGMTMCENKEVISYGHYHASCSSYFDSLVANNELEKAKFFIFDLISDLFKKGYVDSANLYLEHISRNRFVSDKNILFIWQRFKRQYHSSKGNHNEAMNHAKQALNIAIEQNNGIKKAKCFNDMAIIFNAKGNYEKSIEYYKKSLVIKETLGLNPMIGYTLNNIGILYQHLNDPQSALPFFNRALSIYQLIDKSEGIDMSQDIADIYLNIGLVSAQVNDFKVGNESLDKAIKSFKKSGSPKQVSDALVVYAKIKNLEKSYHESINLINQAEDLEQNHQLQPYIDLPLVKSAALLGQKHYAQAIKYANKAKQMAIEHTDTFNQIKAVDLLAKIQEALGDHASALSYLKQHAELTQNMTEKKLNDKLIELQSEMRFRESEKQRLILDKDNEIQSLEISKQRLQLISLIVLLMILLGVFYLIYRRKKIETLQLKSTINDHEVKYQQLGEVQEQIKQLLSNTDEPIICCDMAGYVVFTNHAFDQIYGSTEKSTNDLKIDNYCPVLLQYFHHASTDQDQQHNHVFKNIELDIDQSTIKCDLHSYVFSVIYDYIIMHLNIKNEDNSNSNFSTFFHNLNQFHELSAKLNKIATSVSNIDALESDDLTNQIKALEESLAQTYNPTKETEQKEQMRHSLVDLMCACVDTWELNTQTDKITLAEKSRIWRVSIDNGRIRTRSMDRYLSINALPKKPRWRYVVRTAHYVLANCQLNEKDRKGLTKQLNNYTKLVRSIT